MLAFVTLNLILGIVFTGVMRIALVVGVSGVHLDDGAADVTGFGVPAHVIAYLQACGVDAQMCRDRPQLVGGFSGPFDQRGDFLGMR
jgi:hypothetical protein